MKQLMCEWQRAQNQCLPNLNVLKVNDVVVGFIYKPCDTKTDRNAWRIYRGVGDSAEFMCHNFSKTAAMATLNRIFAGNTTNIVFAEPIVA